MLLLLSPWEACDVGAVAEGDVEVTVSKEELPGWERCVDDSWVVVLMLLTIFENDEVLVFCV